MSKRQNDLGPGEFEVLRVLWDLGPANVRAVMEALHDRGREVAYTTVQTMLTRLEQKHFVESNKSGTAFVYSAVISKEHLTENRLKQLLEQLYDGAAGPLVLHLVKHERLERHEIEELHQLIDRLDNGAS